MAGDGAALRNSNRPAPDVEGILAKRKGRWCCSVFGTVFHEPDCGQYHGPKLGGSGSDTTEQEEQAEIEKAGWRNQSWSGSRKLY